jgi:DNA-binding NarL/FixJ family response regulator
MIPIKLFIVDDHYMVIEGIRSLLINETGVEWMGHATNADSCLSYLKMHQPDIIFMDINLPDINGIDLCRQVKQLYPGIFIIGLSTFNQQSFIEKMMEHGASGYVLKNASKDELIEAITAVVKGKIYLSDDVGRILKDSNKETKPVITSREKEVLELIADGLTNMEIANKLFVSNTTVETHRKNLLAKFPAKNTAELVRMAIYYNFISVKK